MVPVRDPGPKVANLFLFFVVGCRLSYLVCSIYTCTLTSSYLPLSLVGLVRGSTVYRVFLLRFVPSTVVASVYRVCVRVGHVAILLRSFLVDKTRVVLYYSLLYFIKVRVVRVLDYRVSYVSMVRRFVCRYREELYRGACI